MKNTGAPDKQTLRNDYQRYARPRTLIVRDLMALIENAVQTLPTSPAIKGRPKDFDSFYKKYTRLLRSAGGGGLPQITDLLGIRVICPFIEDLSLIENTLRVVFEVLEVDRKGSRHTFKEFGYESTHLLIKIPPSLINEHGNCGSEVAEIQIRTILQDAWAEVEHELVYKAEFTPFDEPMKRKLAAVNASLSLADIVFQEIRSYQRQLNGELGKRRDSFFRKIEESTDRLLFEDEKETPLAAIPQMEPVTEAGADSMDDMLLHALSAHNGGQFERAIELYSRILEMNPANAICSLIYKHRGMANFAQSQYEAAIQDFTCAFDLDGGSYKAVYYRGVVQSVLQRYNEAIDDFSLSLKINPYQPFCLYRRGQAYYHIGDYPQALADCDAALSLEGDTGSIGKFRSLVMQKLKL